MIQLCRRITAAELSILGEAFLFLCFLLQMQSDYVIFASMLGIEITSALFC